MSGNRGNTNTTVPLDAFQVSFYLPIFFFRVQCGVSEEASIMDRFLHTTFPRRKLYQNEDSTTACGVDSRKRT
jgi:hypothetical protein